MVGAYGKRSTVGNHTLAPTPPPQVKTNKRQKQSERETNFNVFSYVLRFKAEIVSAIVGNFLYDLAHLVCNINSPLNTSFKILILGQFNII